MSVYRSKELPVYRKVLGKTLPEPYPLIRHLVDTAAVASVLWDEVLSTQQKNVIIAGTGGNAELARALTVLIAGLHDIGKAHAHWQPTLKVGSDSLTLIDSSMSEPLPLPEYVDEGVREHQLAGGVFFADAVNGTRIKNRALRSNFSRVAWAHHGVFSSENLREIMKVKGHLFNDPGWVKARQDIESAMMSLLAITDAALADQRKWSNEALVLITGVVILADWTASRSDFIGGAEPFVSDERDFEHSQARAKEFFTNFGVTKAVWQESVSWNKMFEFSPNALQASLVDLFEGNGGNENIPDLSKGGICVMTAPMGAGKTEAALYAASKWGQLTGASGIWVTLPTQATTEAMFDRAIEISPRIFEGEEHSVSLMHGNASISAAAEGVSRKGLAPYLQASEAVSTQEQVETEEGCNDGSSLFISSFLVEKKLGGLAGVTVSTVDQLLTSALRLKHTPLRWLGAAGNVIILDEIHDFDEYTFGLIKRLVSWCGAMGAPVIAMSATLTGESQRDLIEAYWSGKAEVDRTPVVPEFLSAIPDSGIVSPSWVVASPTPAPLVFSEGIDFKVDYAPYSASLVESESFVDVVSESVREVVEENRGQLLVTCNTVAQAIGVYETVKNESPEVEVLLLHSKMPPVSKASIVSKVLALTGKNSGEVGRKPLVLISTQIVEQSMDIDFDAIVTALAPLDSVLQRIGRVHRHAQPRAEAYDGHPEVKVVVHPSVARLSKGLAFEEEEAKKVVGVLPYSIWEILATLEVLQKFVGIGDNVSIDIKGDMNAVFLEYATVRKNAGLGIGNPMVSAAYGLYKTSVLSLVSQSDLAVIPPPLFSESEWSKVTTKRTPKSIHAPKTRFIEEEGLNVVLYSIADNAINGQALDYLDSKEVWKLTGQNSMSMDYRRTPQELIVDPTSQGYPTLVPEHITLLNADELTAREDLAFSEDKGLYFPASISRAWL